MNGYEEKLQLVERFSKTKQDVSEICRLADDVNEEGNLEKIKEIAQQILEDY